MLIFVKVFNRSTNTAVQRTVSHSSSVTLHKTSFGTQRSKRQIMSWWRRHFILFYFFHSSTFLFKHMTSLLNSSKGEADNPRLCFFTRIEVHFAVKRNPSVYPCMLINIWHTAGCWGCLSTMNSRLFSYLCTYIYYNNLIVRCKKNWLFFFHFIKYTKAIACPVKM